MSGAGDSVLAAISTSLTAGMKIFEASAFGSVVASCAVEIMGNFPIDIKNVTKKMKNLSG